MHHGTSSNGSRVVRAVRVAGSARVAVTAAAVAAGLLAGQAHGASPAAGTNPGLDNGALTIRGSSGDDTIALRLAAGDPNTLEIDEGDDGTADFSFDRTSVTSISVDARCGADVVRVDDSNGAFTDSI